MATKTYFLQYETSYVADAGLLGYNPAPGVHRTILRSKNRKSAKVEAIKKRKEIGPGTKKYPHQAFKLGSLENL